MPTAEEVKERTKSVARRLVQRPLPAERGDTPDGRRLVAAPRVVAMVVVTLLVCALLDANSLVATVSHERYGTARSVELALVKPFRAVSRATGLDLPLRWVNSLRNVGQPKFKVAPEVAVPPPTSVLPPPATGASGVASATLPLPGTTTAAPPGGMHTGPTTATPTTRAPATTAAPTTVPTTKVTTRPAPPPSHRVPTTKAPLKVWLAGDSLMGSIAQAFEESTASDSRIAPSVNYQVGTGLARPDVYNWPAEVAKEMATANPDVVVVVFGANDDQDMMVNGNRLSLGTPQWSQEYERRINQIATEVVTSKRTLIWLEVPPTIRPQINSADAVIDADLAAVAKLHPGMEVVNLAPPVTTPSGGYTEYLPSGGGEVQVRDQDGVHFTVAGANRIIPLILAAVRQEWRV